MDLAYFVKFVGCALSEYVFGTEFFVAIKINKEKRGRWLWGDFDGIKWIWDVTLEIFNREINQN